MANPIIIVFGIGEKSMKKGVKSIIKFKPLGESERAIALSQFTAAYEMLEDVLYTTNQRNFQAVITSTVAESRPPKNISYILAKITIDKILERTTNKIHRLLDIT